MVLLHHYLFHVQFIKIFFFLIAKHKQKPSIELVLCKNCLGGLRQMGKLCSNESESYIFINLQNIDIFIMGWDWMVPQ